MTSEPHPDDRRVGGLDQALLYDRSAQSEQRYRPILDALLSANGAAVFGWLDEPGDAVLLGGLEPFSTLRVHGHPDRRPLRWEYWSGAAWAPLVVDEELHDEFETTDDWLSLSWTAPAGWRRSLQGDIDDGLPRYWVRAHLPGAAVIASWRRLLAGPPLPIAGAILAGVLALGLLASLIGGSASGASAGFSALPVDDIVPSDSSPADAADVAREAARTALHDRLCAGAEIIALDQPVAPFMGDLPYRSRGDSPFLAHICRGDGELEDFEDHEFNTAGVTADVGGVTSVTFGPSIHDSVDGDDGVVDGTSLDGDSYYSSSGSSGITFSFDESGARGLPVFAGIVWTDGGLSAPVTFEAFGADGQSLGAVVGEHADAGNRGETGEDRFYGVIEPSGISAIAISNAGGGIEVDHLQFGWGTP